MVKKEVFLKNRKGITLIALVITIIVLLILAGITINLTIRRKWIIKKSKSSEEQEIQSQNITTAGNYYIHVLTTDNAGNVKETISEQAVIKSGYAISTPQDLQNINNNLSASYYVVNDIDMSGFNFTKMGTFKGSIDGQGYTISNLKITGESGVAMFRGVRDNAKISNIIFKDVDIRASEQNAAVLAYTIDTYGDSYITIEKVGITGNLSAKGNCASFISYINSAGGSTPHVSFINCYARTNLSTTSGYDSAGLAISWNGHPTTAQYCYWSDTNNTTNRVTSLIYPKMEALPAGAIKNCYYDKQKFPNSVDSSISGTGLTTEQMKTQSSYVGWNFENTWYMGPDGYPELKFD